MSKFNPNYFGIIFTVIFVGFIFILITLLQNNSLDEHKISISAISAIVLFSIGYYYRKKGKPKKFNYVVSDRTYYSVFFLGIIIGLGTQFGLEIAYGIDYLSSEPIFFLYGILLAMGSYSSFYFFTVMAMITSIIRIPIIKRKIEKKHGGETRVIPFIEGSAIGFGTFVVLDLFRHGITKLSG